MERIVLEVDNSLAKAWRSVSPSVRMDYEKKISGILKELKEVEFDHLLDKAGRIAAANGLTEEKLNILLNDED